MRKNRNPAARHGYVLNGNIPLSWQLWPEELNYLIYGKGLAESLPALLKKVKDVLYLAVQ